jgi:hypothetical protein
MATSVVTDVYGYAVCRWALMQALVGLSLLLMSVAGKLEATEVLKPCF